MFVERIVKSSLGGVLPKAWRVVLVDSVAQRGSGHTPNKKHPEYWNGGIKWVSLKDSDKLDRRYIADTEETISEAGLANSSAVLHPAGTVILSRDAGVGKSAIMQDTMAVSQHFIAWRCGELLDNHFLFYWLQFMKPEFERVAVGSTILTIGLPYFRKLRMLLPPLPEQRAIAALLGTWDRAIEQTTQLIEAKQQARDRLRERLTTGRLRLAGRTAEWPIIQLADVCTIVAGRTPRRNVLRYWANSTDTRSFPWAAIGDMNGKWLRITKERITPAAVQEAGLRPAAAGTTLMSYKLSIGRTARAAVDIYHNEAIAAFRPTGEGVDPDYLFYALPSMVAGCDQAQAAKGATLGLSQLRSLWVSLPPMGEQRSVASLLAMLDAELQLVTEYRLDLQRQKRALADKLLTGRVRLPEDA